MTTDPFHNESQGNSIKRETKMKNRNSNKEKCSRSTMESSPKNVHSEKVNYSKILKSTIRTPSKEENINNHISEKTRFKIASKK